MSNSLRPHGIVHGIFQARIQEWAAFPFPSPGMELRSPALQVDSVPAEPQGKGTHGLHFFFLLELQKKSFVLTPSSLYCFWHCALVLAGVIRFRGSQASAVGIQIICFNTPGAAVISECLQFVVLDPTLTWPQFRDSSTSRKSGDLLRGAVGNKSACMFPK